MSNNFLARLFSAEYIAMFIGFLVAGSFAWATMENKVDSAIKDGNEIKATQKEIVQKVQRIETDTEVIKLDLDHTKKTIDRVEQDIKAIRSLLER